MGDFCYTTECSMCESSVTVFVADEDELPIFCPMCGSETEYTAVED